MASFTNVIKNAAASFVNVLKPIFGFLATEDEKYILTESGLKLFVEPVVGGGVWNNQPKV